MFSRSRSDDSRTVSDDSRSISDDRKWRSKLLCPSLMTLEALFMVTIFLYYGSQHSKIGVIPLQSNIRLEWKGLSATNTLVTELITLVKSFMMWALGHKNCKRCHQFTDFDQGTLAEGEGPVQLTSSEKNIQYFYFAIIKGFNFFSKRS